MTQIMGFSITENTIIRLLLLYVIAVIFGQNRLRSRCVFYFTWGGGGGQSGKEEMKCFIHFFKESVQWQYNYTANEHLI